MPKHSQILERLEQNSTEQTKQIEQLHAQAVENLEQNLTAIYSEKLNTIRDDTVKTIHKTVKIELQSKNKLILATSIALTLIVSISATWYATMSYYTMSQQTPPPKEIIKEAPPPITHSAQPNTDVTEQITKLMIENKNLRSDNTKQDQAIKSYQAQIKELRAWNIPEKYQGTGDDGTKWLLTDQTKEAKNGQTWALIRSK